MYVTAITDACDKGKLATEGSGEEALWVMYGNPARGEAVAFAEILSPAEAGWTLFICRPGLTPGATLCRALRALAFGREEGGFFFVCDPGLTPWLHIVAPLRGWIAVRLNVAAHTGTECGGFRA